MPTLAEAQAKWERKTANAGAKWDAKKADMKAGFANSPKYAILGVRPGAMTINAYNQGVDAASGASLQAGVTGKGPKWAANFRAGFSM